MTEDLWAGAASRRRLRTPIIASRDSYGATGTPRRSVTVTRDYQSFRYQSLVESWLSRGVRPLLSVAKNT
jgi:hypothetical protein